MGSSMTVGKKRKKSRHGGFGMGVEIWCQFIILARKDELTPDFGCGDAIQWALQEGNSTKQGPNGLGLYLLQDFVRVNGG